MGTLVIELAGAASGRPEVVTSVQHDLASVPTEIARYPLRKFLALVLRAMRAARRHRRALPVRLKAAVPRALRRAQVFALAKFVRVNFEMLMLLAHGRGRRLPFALASG